MRAPATPDIARLIETLQLSEFRRAKLRPPEHDADGMRAWFERMHAERLAFEGGGVAGREAADRLVRKYRNAYEARPPTSRYELIHFYMYLVVVAQDAVADIRVRRPDAKGLDDLVFGMIPSTYPNAIILPLAGGVRTAVLFNFATFSLAFGLARFVATYGDLTIWPTGEYVLDLRPQTLVQNMAAAPAEFDRLMGTLEAILFGSTEALSIDVQRPPMPKGRNYQFLLSGMVRFLVSHELAHVVQRHSGPPRLYQRLIAPLQYGKKTVGAVSKLQETEADGIGLRMSIAVHDTLARNAGVTDTMRRGTGAVLDSYVGADLILGMFEVLETVAQLHIGNQQPVALQSSTHPTVHERRLWIREQVQRDYPGMKDVFDNWTDTSREALALIATAFLNRLKLRGSAGRPLSPMWSKALADAGVLSEATAPA